MSSGTPSKPASRSLRVIDGVTVMILLGTLALLLETRIDKRAAERRTREQLEALAAEAPKRGAELVPIAVLDSTGQRRIFPVAGDSDPQVIYVFKTDCPACGAQKPDWRILADMAHVAGWNVTALTAEPLAPWVRGYFDAASIGVYQIEDPIAAGRSLGARVVPITILVGADGRIIAHYAGKLSPAATDSLKAILSSSVQ